VKLPFMDADNNHRARIAKAYTDGLCGLALTLPMVPAYAEPAWHLYVVRHSQRDKLAKRLSESGIATVIHYPVSPHLQPAYAKLNIGKGSQPIAERLQGEVLSLPIGPCQSDLETQTVIRMVREVLNSI
jgi:dTDP-4-amino-4,6-dideoxygalactose transaminase